MVATDSRRSTAAPSGIRAFAPSGRAGRRCQAGEYLLAVDGKEIKTDSEVYRWFEGTVGKRVELKIGPKSRRLGLRASWLSSRSVTRAACVIAPGSKATSQGSRATKGKVAYVYVPNTAGAGHEYFKRYFYPQADKAAIIVDERFNGGGQVADYYINMLRRPLVSFWATRHGEPIRTPNAAILGPKVMIIDESAGSGGDLLPWMFRKFGLGNWLARGPGAAWWASSASPS